MLNSQGNTSSSGRQRYAHAIALLMARNLLFEEMIHIGDRDVKSKLLEDSAKVHF